MANNAPGRFEREGISLIQLFKMFPDDESAEKWFIHTRWPDGMACPRCGSVNVNEHAAHATMPHRCRDCDKRFSVKLGTMMESSNLGYQIWIIALYLFNTSLKGVSSLKVHRDLNITQRTGWYLMHRIRESLSWGEKTLFDGPVEVDETYIGGKEANKHAKKKLHENWRDGKIGVVGMKERETKQVSAAVIDHADEETLLGFISERVEDGATVYTDGAYEYRGMDYPHEWVSHSRGEYVRGECSTNGIESFWSMIKRAIMGVYHYVSRKHLGRYVLEFVTRQNIRPRDTIDQMKLIVQGFEGKRLKYCELIA